ncbi:MAG: NAD(P)H-dependent oxidoreductase [Solirubrobacteraceae bacterium]|nr:NAD(P)H-dependent oxidoreductase [Solirubrobacteraceae bacterium]
MPKLTVIIASTRPGRQGLAIGEWFAAYAAQDGRFDVSTVDLAELDLPLMDEPNHPRMARYEHDHTKAWSATVAGSDAFVFVTPEYNHSFPAPLKNAIDYLHNEWAYKPVGFVSYGGVAAGTRAVQALKPVVSVLKGVPVTEAVSIPFFSQFIDDDGVVQANEVMTQGATAMLAELERIEASLRPLRS